jgi:hypothetical protein
MSPHACTWKHSWTLLLTGCLQDGSSKEGAGRVALFRETGLVHLYTIEANYNTGTPTYAVHCLCSS